MPVLALRGVTSPPPGTLVVAFAGAALGYIALARGARLLPVTYAAIMAGVAVAAVAGRLHGSL